MLRSKSLRVVSRIPKRHINQHTPQPCRSLALMTAPPMPRDIVPSSSRILLFPTRVQQHLMIGAYRSGLKAQPTHLQSLRAMFHPGIAPWKTATASKGASRASMSPLLQVMIVSIIAIPLATISEVTVRIALHRAWPQRTLDIILYQDPTWPSWKKQAMHSTARHPHLGLQVSGTKALAGGLIYTTQDHPTRANP